MDTIKQNNISVDSFNTSLIASEIIVTAIALIGFYLIFNHFNNKNKAFKAKNK